MSYNIGYVAKFRDPHPEASTEICYCLNVDQAKLFKDMIDNIFDYEDKINWRMEITDNGNWLHFFDEDMFQQMHLHSILEEVLKQ
jgi:hypothetical protein